MKLSFGLEHVVVDDLLDARPLVLLLLQHLVDERCELEVDSLVARDLLHLLVQDLVPEFGLGGCGEGVVVAT